MLELVRGVAGRVDRVENPDGTHRSFTYDREGRVVHEEGSDGSSVIFQRDTLGRLIGATAADASGTHTTLFERDALGRIVAERQGDRVLRFTYDAHGRRVERVLFEGTRTRYAYDREGALTQLEHAGQRIAFQRDAAGRETSRGDELGRFGIFTTYDPLDRPTMQRVLGPELPNGTIPALAQRQLSYDAAGRATRVNDPAWGASTELRYDRAGRLIGADFGDHKTAYHYDAASSLVGIDQARWKMASGASSTTPRAASRSFTPRVAKSSRS